MTEKGNTRTLPAHAVLPGQREEAPEGRKVLGERILARVVFAGRDIYRIHDGTGEKEARLKRSAFNDPGALWPVVGDYVRVERNPKGEDRILEVLPRHTHVARVNPQLDQVEVLASNMDTVMIVTSLNGDFNMNRVERYLATTREGGADPVVVLTKADLCTDAPALLASMKARLGTVPVHAVSAVTGAGMEALAAYIRPGATVALLGSSGVGKSTLVNAFVGGEAMATGSIRAKDMRGRHTTTHRALLRLPQGAWVLDTPGLRELLPHTTEAQVEDVFEEIQTLSLACRFKDCTHGSEPDCAVRLAREEGRLPEGRWSHYQKLLREAQHSARKGKQGAGRRKPKRKALKSLRIPEDED